MNAGTVARFLLPALALLVGVGSAASETIRVGIMSSSEPLYELKTSAPFVQALEESFPQGEVETVRLSEVMRSAFSAPTSSFFPHPSF